MGKDWEGQSSTKVHENISKNMSISIASKHMPQTEFEICLM